MSERVEVFKDVAGDWRWRRVSGADIVSTSGEGYVNKSYTVEMAQEKNPGIPVVEVDKEIET